MSKTVSTTMTLCTYGEKLYGGPTRDGKPPDPNCRISVAEPLSFEQLLSDFVAANPGVVTGQKIVVSIE